MPSTYSNLKIQLMATGENNTTWGNVTNVNLGTALEEAIVGSADVAFSSADVTLTLTDTNAAQTARNMRLNLTGTATAGYNLVVPAIEKPYIVNNGTDGTITVKNTTGTGIAVPAGKTMWVFNNGTNVVDVVTHLSSVTLGSALPVASGGTGVTTSTGTGSVVLSASPSFTGTVNFGPSIITGTGLSTGDAQLELGGNRTGSGLAYIDLHSIAGGDFQSRLVRYAGANGGLDLIQTGTGGMAISNEGSADTVFKTNALERIRITNAGNVGIGTASPATLLSVNGSATANENFFSVTGGVWFNAANVFTRGIAQAGSDVALYTSGTEKMRIDSSGNVGIGTTGGDFSRTWRLVARQDQNAITNIGVINANTGASASAQISKITGTGNSFVDWALADNGGSPYDTFSYGSAVQYVSWGFGGSERMRLASSGFVGVGTSTDNGVDKLTVAGIVGSYISGRAGFHLYNGGATAEWFIGQPSASSHNLTFSKLVSGTYTDYVAIDSTGNVGIGNTSPTVTLDVTGGIKTSRTAVTAPATSDGNIFSGTYTPTLTNSTNVDISNSTAYTCQYMRVGDVVTVSGKVSIAVIGSGITRLNMTLPVSSNFSAEENCAGTAQVSYNGVSTNLAAQIKADTTNDRAQILYFGNVTGAAQDFFFTFTYRVI